MKNPLVGDREAQDIRRQVGKVLRDIGNPEPPLRLELVRDRLGLDRQYYSVADTSFVRDTVHAIKVAGKQILRRPSLLIEAIAASSLKALWLPDSKRILIDRQLPLLKHRWAEGHEIGHALTPWHCDYLMGDAESELSPSCYATIEAEANYASGQLLFLQGQFVDEANSLPPTIDSIKRLKERYGNTYTSTLWRFIEEYRGPNALVGVICAHPHHQNGDFDHAAPCRYVVQSPHFREKFSSTSEIALFNEIAGYCGRQRGGPLGNAEIILTDLHGLQHAFYFETFFFHYQALTIGVELQAVRSRGLRRPAVC